ncbi:hypothetical protein L484_023885 [Morus notabilis]|uniref:Uncharacterized protein n=1 Tax=Morus notabilis TaxID=981085 RepID=W9RTV3_9ROSA|nr:hypothetical protein L484_023885 [Morus notabilis]
MSTFRIPQQICEDMNKAVRRFWWTGNSQKTRYLALVDWNLLCQPKDWGRFGFRRFEDFNLALLAKLEVTIRVIMPCSCCVDLLN